MEKENKDKEIGERIKKLRREKNMTQEELANISGIAQANISAIEKGNRSVPRDGLIKIAEAFDVPVRKITHGEDTDTVLENRVNKLEKKVLSLESTLVKFMSELKKMSEK